MIYLHGNFQRLTARPTELKLGIFLPMKSNWRAYFFGGISIKRKKKRKNKERKRNIFHLMSIT